VRGHQDPPGLLAGFLDIGRIVVQIAQDKLGVDRQFAQQGWCDFIVRRVGRCEFGG